MRQGSRVNTRCPSCGTPFEVALSDGMETKAVSTFEPKTPTFAMRFAVKSVDRAQRIIEGYASTPDLDQGGDIVDPGACKFKDAGDVGVFIGHDWRFGALPVGVPIEIREDANGLFTKTRIYETARGDELLTIAEERLAAGKPLGQSIGYPTDSVKAQFERKDGKVVRRISSLDLREYSFTPIPMNERALTTAVKDRATAVKEMSAEERRSEIGSAINQRFAKPATPSSYMYVVSTYDDRVIVCDENAAYWQISYTLGADDAVTLGDPVEVEQTWTPKTATAAKSKPITNASAISGLLELELAVARTH